MKIGPAYATSCFVCLLHFLCSSEGRCQLLRCPLVNYAVTLRCDLLRSGFLNSSKERVLFVILRLPGMSVLSGQGSFLSLYSASSQWQRQKRNNPRFSLQLSLGSSGALAQPGPQLAVTLTIIAALRSFGCWFQVHCGLCLTLLLISLSLADLLFHCLNVLFCIFSEDQHWLLSSVSDEHCKHLLS